MHFLHSGNRLKHAVAVCLPILLSLFIIHDSYGQAISCISEVNVSLDNNCNSVIEPIDVLSEVDDNETYTIELTDHQNNVILNNTLTVDQLWTQVMVKVTNSGGNSCWGVINVEDKLAPIITCIDTIRLDCYSDLDTFPTHMDNCETSSISLFSETIKPLHCDVNFIKQIDRVFQAVDPYGNKSQCEQTVQLRRIDLSLIVFPDTFSIDNGNPLSCSTTTFDADGFPDFDSAGVPTLNGEPLFPNVDVYCNIAADYEDILVVDQLCVKKYMRTWTVYELWCSNGPYEEYFQVIEVVDNEAPEIAPLLNINVAAGTGPNCEASVILPIPVVTDDCPGPISVDISYNGGFLRNVKTPQTVTFPAGIDTVTYRAYDACGNSDSMTINVAVIDNTPPTAVCDRNTVVSLRSDGTAKAWAHTFDDGSFDNCGTIFKSVVRRLDNACDCDTARFKDMSFLGQRNGRFYYLSDNPVFGFQAIGYPQAFGGMPLALESESEALWIQNRVSSITSDPYYIGLSYKDNVDQYLYPGHTAPSYTNWATAEPASGGTHVIVNADGTWQTVNGGTTTHRYIYEATIPCGFSDEVKFCCGDAGNTVMLKFRALDKFGGFNECNVTVEVQDKVAPVIQCPSDRTLDCSVSINTNDLSIYGSATATDACTSNINDTVSSTLNGCGVGQIVRTFTASDANGMSTCRQTLSLLSSSASTGSSIIWPEDFDTDQGCMSADIEPANLPAGFDFPNLTGASCTSLSATFSDKTFSFPGQGSVACFKVVRTWTVIDACMQGMPGYTPVTYEQSIKVSDTVEPTPASCNDINVSTASCSGESITVTGSATDNCTAVADINSRIAVDIDSDGTIDDDQSYNNMISYTRNFPLGTHTATLQYFDGCGNIGTCTQRIRVTSNVAPIAKCVPGLSIPLQQMDLDGNNTIDTIMATITATMLDAANPSLGTVGSSHPCNYNVRLSLSPSVTDVMRTFSCDEVGDNSVDLYVTGPDAITTICNTTVTITDVNNYCMTTSNNKNVELGGNIMTELTEAVEDVQVDLLGSDMPYEMTQNDGTYAFPQMSTGGDYMLVPTKNDNPLNGVSTLDIIRIQRHILGSELLDSPYKVIAADVDNSQSVTALDMIELRKLILGINDEFSDVDSWKIIDSDQTFLDPLNPFLFGIQEDVMVENLDNNMVVDFIGIKMGDVNNTVTANAISDNIESRSSESVDLVLVPNAVGDHDYLIDLNIENLNNYSGLQFALIYDPQEIDIIGIDSDLSSFINSNYNIDRANNVIYISWDDKGQDIQTDLLCQLKVSSISDKPIAIAIDQTRLSSEIYENDKVLDINIVNPGIVDTPTVAVLYQNIPNPWSASTEITFFLDRDQDIELNFYNPAGQLLYREIKTGHTGENISVIDNNTFSNGGIIYYELVTESTRIIDKMLLVK